MSIDAIFIILFIVMILALVIEALIGLWKGCWKTGFKVIFRTILFVILIFTAQPITNAVCSFDLQATFGVNFTLFDIQFTSLNDFLINILMTKGNISPVTGQTLYATCEALAHSILSFAFFFVLALLAWLFGSLLGALFYHLLFKRLIPLRIRKNKKIRWLGSIFGLLDGVVCLVMVISPLSALGNVVVNHKETLATMEKNGALSESTYTNVNNVLEAYDSSILGKTLNAFAPFCDNIMNGVVTVNLHGANLNFYRQIDSLITIFTPLLDNVEDLNNQQFKLASLIAKDNVQNFLYLVSDNQLVITLIPALILMGEQISEDPTVSSVISKMDLNDINWKDNIVAVSNFYGKLYDTGILSNTPETGTLQDVVVTFDFGKLDDYAEAINTVTDIPLIKDNLSTIMGLSGTMINQQLGIEVVPENAEEYKDIDWGKELTTLTTAAVKMVKALDINSFSDINFEEKLIAALNDEEKLNLIKEAICGNEEENIDGLLSLQMVDKVNLTNLFSSTLSSIDQLKGFIDRNDIAKLMENINLEDEISSIIDIAGVALKLPMSNGMLNIDFSNQEDCNLLVNLVEKAENSTIISSIFPKVVKSIFEQNKNINLYGFNYENFNFDFNTTKELVDELKDILYVLPDVMNVVNVVSESMDLSLLDADALENVLNVIYNSKILNPEHRIDGTGTSTDYAENYNFRQLVQYIFEIQDIKNLGVVVPDNISSITWVNKYDSRGNLVAKGEISKLIDIFKYIQTDGSFLLQGSNMKIEDLSGKDIEKIVSLISESELFAPSLNGILSNMVTPILENIGIECNFKNITSWNEEASHLGKILDLVKIIATDENGNIDTANIDFLSVDKDYLNGILTEMASSKIFSTTIDEKGQYVDIFGKNIYTILIKAGIANIIPDLDEDAFSSINKKDGSLKWSWIDSTSSITKEDILFDITSTGEIANIMNVITKVDRNTIDGLQSGNIDTAVINDVVGAILSTNTISEFVPSLIENVMQKIDPIIIDSNNVIDLNNINLLTFKTMTNAEKKEEIRTLLDIYDRRDNLQNIFNNLYSMSDDDILNLKDLLDDIASLKVFTTKKEDEYYSFFDEIYASIFNSVGVDKLVTNIQDVKKSKSAMLNIIVDIDKWIGDDGENQKIINLFSLLNLLHIDESTLNNPSSLAPSSIKEILYAFNESSLLHRGVSKLFQQIFKGVGIEKLISINGTIYYPIKYFVHLTTSAEDIAYWKNEIDSLFSLVEVLYDDATASYLDTESLNFESSNISSIIVSLDHLDLLAENKEYIIYNLLSSFSGVIDNIRDVQTSYGNSKAARIKKLFFPVGHTDEDLILQTTLLQSFVHDLSDNINKSFDDKDNLVSDTLAYSFIRKTMKANFNYSSSLLEVSSIDRSLFASELITNFVYKGLIQAVENSSATDKETMKESVNSLLYSCDELGNEYKNINVVEARGIQGLIKIASLDFSDFKTAATSLVEAFTYMGQIDSDINSLKTETMSEDDALLIYTHNKYYSSSTANRVNNSKIALLLVEIYLPDSAKTFINYLYDYDPRFTYQYKFEDDGFVFGEFAKALADYYSA